MSIVSRDRPRIAEISFCVSLALAALARPAHAAWGVDPVQVYATSASCPVVAACDDAHFGAIVVWQENTPSGGLLKARHVLANGDVDPAWSAPAVVSTMDVARTAMGAISDRSGGAYVWWMEGAQLYLTRVAASGAVDPAWPARGRSLGMLMTSQLRPSAAGDGSGGVYLAWLGGPLDYSAARVVHLGPANTGTGGWPNGVKTLGTSPVVESANSFAIAAATDGGLWLALATTDTSNPEPAPGDVRLTRFTSAGFPAPGWGTHGVSLAPFRGDRLSLSPTWGPTPRFGLVAVASAGDAGAFVMRTVVSDEGPGIQLPEFRLVRVSGEGTIAPGWAPDGIVVGGLDFLGFGPEDLGAEASLRALPDDRGGVFAGVPGYATEGLSYMSFTRRSSAGTAEAGGITTDQHGLEVASRGDGGMFAATFFPTGPYGPYAPNAYIAASQSAPGEDFLEWHDQPVISWYGDVGLTATGDGGAIFAWSQERERFGIFAIRLGPAGVVTGVPPVPGIGAPSLRVKFVRGEGVHAVASFTGSSRLAFSLHDVAGRRVASFTSAATPGADQVFPGTRELPGGVYFVRTSDGVHTLGARVLVLR
jgi:hypothetical protein